MAKYEYGRLLFEVCAIFAPIKIKGATETKKVENFTEVVEDINKFGKKAVQGAGDELLNAFKSGFSKESILAIPKGSRPLPSTYLKPEYITNHLAKFDNGAPALRNL